MQTSVFSRKIRDKSAFVILAELTGGPGFDFAPIENFLNAYKDAGKSSIPAIGCVLVITLSAYSVAVA